MKIFSFSLMALLLLFVFACGDDDNDVQEPAIAPIGECHYLFDLNGQAIGTQGNCDGIVHWGEAELIDREKEWLIFPDSIPFTLGFGQFENINIRVFPAPAFPNGSIFLSVSSDTPSNKFSKIKVAIVDESETLRLVYSQLVIDTAGTILLNLEGIEKGQSYRMYYNLSDGEDSIYFEGYGDFFVCDNLLDYSGCF